MKLRSVEKSSATGTGAGGAIGGGGAGAWLGLLEGRRADAGGSRR